jgi:C-terminal processing protease CtpA/Prc
MYIASVEPGSASDRCHLLQVGQQIVALGGISVASMSSEAIAHLLREKEKEQDYLSIYVADTSSHELLRNYRKVCCG